jgi:hypothetical protein
MRDILNDLKLYRIKGTDYSAGNWADAYVLFQPENQIVGKITA